MTDYAPALLAAATPEQLRAFRLESIFMPEGRRQRDTLYKANPNPRFVHYTRAEAALEIIRKKRLWLRNATAMVDYREIHHGFSLLQSWFAVQGNKKKFIDVFDSIHPGAASQAITAFFDRFWMSNDRGVQTQTYISSISEHDSSEDEHGRLSMWRAFGADALARVALVFRVPVFTDPIIGPSSYPWIIRDAFKRTLEEAGVSDPGAKIITSSIPIRS
jgi:hypothetical protein